MKMRFMQVTIEFNMIVDGITGMLVISVFSMEGLITGVLNESLVRSVVRSIQTLATFGEGSVDSSESDPFRGLRSFSCYFACERQKLEDGV
jgi:hypothetical protein